MGRRASRKKNYDPATWRLLVSAPMSGAMNMAIDEAIMEAVANESSLPTLRFYGWNPPCFSLGFRQEWDVVDHERCNEMGWDVVRRPTGGRAILHIDELTYSVCAPDGEPRVKGGVRESYQRLSDALIESLKQIGLEPMRAKPYYQDHGALGAACFDGPSDYEITIGQRKLIGSAQVRKHGTVLQHGSLPLYGDIARIAEGMWFELPGQRMALASRLGYRATTVETALGRRLEFDEVVVAMQAGFVKALNLELVESHLTPSELERADQLHAEKYAHDSWTKRL